MQTETDTQSERSNETERRIKIEKVRDKGEETGRQENTLRDRERLKKEGYMLAEYPWITSQRLEQGENNFHRQTLQLILIDNKTKKF